MQHETVKLTADERRALKQQFGSIVTALARPQGVQQVSVALMYRVPDDVVKPLLQRLWRY